MNTGHYSCTHYRYTAEIFHDPTMNGGAVDDNLTNFNNVVSKETVNGVVENYLNTKDFYLENYVVTAASKNILGFLSDYWRLRADVVKDNERLDLRFFIKAIPRSNPAKAAMVKEVKLFDKETMFYFDIKKAMNLKGIRTWSPVLAAATDDLMIFEDLKYMGYKNRRKCDSFDISHTLQALETLATFHSTCIVYEEKKRVHDPSYTVLKEFGQYLDAGYYTENHVWFLQCIDGSLEAVREFSKHRNEREVMQLVEKKWKDVFVSALSLGEYSREHSNAVCHRDLWNNNIMFRYEDGDEEPDGCAILDFQAIKLQPPAGDVMMMLHCNLDPNFRENNLDLFLNYYYEKLEFILEENAVSAAKVIPKDCFMTSAKEQRKWGLISSACLLPLTCLEDELVTNIFTDTDRFDDILFKNKGTFIKQMMRENEEYKTKIMELFDEIIDRYILI